MSKQSDFLIVWKRYDHAAPGGFMGLPEWRAQYVSDPMQPAWAARLVISQRQDGTFRGGVLQTRGLKYEDSYTTATHRSFEAAEAWIEMVLGERASQEGVSKLTGTTEPR